MHTPFHLLRVLLIAALALVPASLLAQRTHGTQPADGGAPDHGGAAGRPNAPIMNSGSNFTENRGQYVDTRGMQRPDVLYRASAGGTDVMFTKTSIIYQFGYLEGDLAYYADNCVDGHVKEKDGVPAHDIPEPVMHLERIDMELVGANPLVRVEASDATPEFYNYYLPQCPNGINGVRAFRRLIYRDVYPNIDMVVNATATGTKCDFVVRPGGRASDIQMRFVGATGLSVNQAGAFRMTGTLGTVTQEKPYTYISGADGSRQGDVPSRYVLRDGVLGFDVGAYDSRRTVVIDPLQLWATFYGGNTQEQLNGGDPSEVDRKGNVMITGSTTSNFPIVTQPGTYVQGAAGGTDAFVAKFTGDGRRVWSTIIGGSDSELAHGVATDADGNVFIAGHTFSGSTLTPANNFPTTPGAFQTTNANPGAAMDGKREAFAVKFDTNGVRLWSTYYGGTGFDDGYGFAIDSAHNVALLTTTGSDGISTVPGNFRKGQYDAMIVKLSPAGARIWSQYFGGSQDEYGYAAATDINNSILITGYTYSSSTTFPMVNAYQPFNGGSADAFVIKLDAAGTVKWSTFYGGAGRENDDAFSIAYCGLATDLDGNIFLGGLTTGSLPTVGGVFQPTFRGGTTDGYVVKFDSAGAVQWSTYVGGPQADVAVGVASNARGSVLVTGFTASTTGFPITFAPPASRAAFQSTHAGGTNDAFIVKLDKNGLQQWGTYFGGTGNDQGEGISFDIFGSIIIAGQTTTTTGAPLAFVDPSLGNPIIQANNGGGGDAFISVFCDPETAAIDSSGPHVLCDLDTLSLWVLKGYTTVKWYRKDPAPGTGVNELILSRNKDTVRVSESGRFFAIVTNSGGCEASTDTVDVTKLARLNPTITPSSPVLLCTGDTVTLTAGPGTFTRYAWLRTPTDTVTTQTMKVWVGGTYWLYVWNAFGCHDSAQVFVNEQPKPTPIIAAKDTAICEDDLTTFFATGGVGGNIIWYSTASPTSVGAGASFQTGKPGTYYAVSINGGTGCSRRSNNVALKVNKKPKPRITPLGPTSFCEGDSSALECLYTAGDAVLPGTFRYVSYQWSPGGQTTPRISVSSIPLGTTTFTCTVTDTNGCIGNFSIPITKNPVPHPKITFSPDTVVCEGDTVSLSADQSYSNYAWNNGATDQRIRVGRLGRTPYVLTVFTTEGCSGKADTVWVTVRPKPTANINGPGAVCINSTQSYDVPSQPGVTYTWSLQGPSGTIASGAGTNKIDVDWGAAGANKVIVAVTNPTTGCKAYDTLDVTVGSLLKPNVTANRSLQLCAGDSVVLDAGTGFASYLWSTGEKTQTITVKTPGSYTVTVANAAGCSGTSDPVVVTNVTATPPTITGNPATLTGCAGDTVELDAGPGYTDYLWSNGASIRKIRVTRTDSLQVTGTDSNGCKATSAIARVTINPLPVPAIAGPNSACINSTIPYTVSFPGSGAGDTYTWQVLGTHGTITNGQGTNTVSIQWNTSGDDSMEVTVKSGATGCTGTTRYVVTVGTKLTPVLTTATGRTTFCSGDSIVLKAPAGYTSYSWAPTNETSDTIIVRTPGTYTVTVNDAFGCSGSGDITVTQNAPYKPTVTAPKLGFCPGDSVKLEAPATYASYVWSPTGETTPAIWAKTPGVYTVTTTDVEGCVGTSDPLNVTQNPVPLILRIDQNGTELVAVVDETAGPAVAGYQWYKDSVAIPGATLARYTTTIAANYEVVVTSVDGCVSRFGPVRPTLAASSEVELPTLTAAPGERVIVPLMLTGSTNLDRNQVMSFEAKLRFNKTLLVPLGSTPNAVTGNERIMTITGKRGANVTSGELMRLEFMAALGDEESTPLTLEGFRWIDTAFGPTQVSVVNGLFTLTNICETGGKRLLTFGKATKITSVRPNPTSGLTEIEYSLVERGRTEVYVVDVLGNRVATLVDGDVPPGSYQVTWDASRTASGLYYCVLVTPTERMTHVVHVVR